MSDARQEFHNFWVLAVQIGNILATGKPIPAETGKQYVAALDAYMRAAQTREARQETRRILLKELEDE